MSKSKTAEDKKEKEKAETELVAETMTSEEKEESKEIEAGLKEAQKAKEYTVESFKTPLTKDEKAEFDKLDKDEQKKFIIKRWTLENRGLDTPDMHEVSLEDQQFAGLVPVST